MKKNMFISVEPGDIFMWGDETFWPEENGGNTAFGIFDAGRKDWHTSYVLLRSILQAIGEEYKVWRIDEYEDEDHDMHMIFYTNMPKDVYEKACEQSLLNPKNPNETCIWADDVLIAGDEEEEDEDEPTPKTLRALEVKEKIDELKTMVVKMDGMLEAFREFGLGDASSQDISFMFDKENHIDESVLLAYIKLSQSLVSMADGAQDTREELRLLFDRVFSNVSPAERQNLIKKYKKDWELI